MGNLPEVRLSEPFIPQATLLAPGPLGGGSGTSGPGTCANND